MRTSEAGSDLPGHHLAPEPMSKTITVTIPHDLGRAEAKRRLREGFGSFESELAGLSLPVTFRERWDGDRLDLVGGALGQTVQGRVDVMDDALRITLSLPTLLANVADTMSPRVRRALRQAGTRLLEHER